ncbi:hypothetical protein GCM10023317_73170 [Actinopolymorpha pittospori]|uniref:Divalent metal cation (Fe/Co/Zn/Cd) transporter n=1 Tax=Actinopolymorpha pittospori TaxID=648752 RepID=A0A927RKE9_9ACTN|nr:divalent metal cation (Fe/Co/Zn/Cd) transporter [Actinopolymorpha pittospori]
MVAAQCVDPVLLVGLGVNSLFGWWWADPLAALVIAGVAVKEGLEIWRGDACCTVPVTQLVDGGVDPTDDVCGCGPGCDCCGSTQTKNGSA